MKKIVLLSTLGIMLLAFAPNLSAQSCPPFGPGPIYGPLQSTYNYTADGGPPTSTACWTLFNTMIRANSMTCGFYPQWTWNSFEFGYGGDIDQTFTIPATDHRTTYWLTYFVDFIDPTHNPAFNQLNIEVFDNTAHVRLITDHYDGSHPDLNCARRDSAVFQGDLAGHSISVRIMGSTPDTNTTHIRVSQVGFWGQG